MRPAAAGTLSGCGRACHASSVGCARYCISNDLYTRLSSIIGDRSREHFSHIECSNSMDSRILLSGDQSRAARALLNWSRVRLAAKANLSEMTISDFENGYRAPRPHNIAAMRHAFEDAGIIFTLEGAPSLATDNRMWRRRQRKA